jgi:TolB protein
MTVTAPPRPPRPSDPVTHGEFDALVEALVEEARRRGQRRRRRNGAIVTLVGLVGVALFALLGRSAQSQTESPALSARSSVSAGALSSKIAFIREPPWGYAGVLWIMNPDGSGQRKLAPAFPGMRWSPDGQKIAYTSSGNSSDLYVMNADGSGQERLTSDPGNENNPEWSPDGRAIAFSRWTPGDRSIEIAVINADGSEQRRLTSNGTADFGGGVLAWSPVGAKIAFVGVRDGNAEIYVINADGSGQRRLTRNAGRDSNLVWSPDGRRIAFVSNWQVWVMNADGSGQRRLTRAEVLEVTVKNETRAEGNYSIYVRTNESQRSWYTGMTYRSRGKAQKVAQTIRERGTRSVAPAWSPDGRRIAFERRLGRERHGRCDGCGGAVSFHVYVMNADGSEERRLAQDGAQPVWSPDGKMIAFGWHPTARGIALRRQFDIYVVNADGSGQRNLTRTRRRESWPVWSPAQR